MWWPFTTAKKAEQESRIYEAESKLAEARRTYSAAIVLMQESHDKQVREMIQGLVPSHREKSE